MKKIIILAFFVLTILMPTQAQAFQVERFIDPFCLFACDDEEVHTTNVVVTQVVTQSLANTNQNSNTNSNTSTNPLGVSCYSNPSTGPIGTNVIWGASPYGGNGNYSIAWSGNDGLSGSGTSINKVYNTIGLKTASVTVTSDGQTIAQTCGNNVNIYDISIPVPTPVYPHHNSQPIAYNSYTSPLGVSCYSNPSSGGIGDSIRWVASPYGGNGNYSISWSGTDGLSGSGTNIYKNYYNTGSKYASVTVTSDGQTITQSCSNTVDIYSYNNNYDPYYNNNYYNNYNYNSPLSISCRPNVTFAPVETTVIWNAYASGGNGNYNYRWNGSDYLQGYNNSLAVIYHSPGPKTASITVTSGNQTITQACLNGLTVGVPNQAYYNNTYTPPPVVKYITKTKIVKVKDTKTETVAKTESKPIVENKPVAVEDNALSATSLFSLKNVPWGWVAVLIILVLFATVIYLIFNRNKI